MNGKQGKDAEGNIKRRRKRKITEESRRYTRKIKRFTKTLGEEEVITKKRLHTYTVDETETDQNILRIEKNKRWRERRSFEENEKKWKKKTTAISEILKCHICEMTLCVRQCLKGHIVCEECSRGCLCKHCGSQVKLKNFAVERIVAVLENQK